MLGTWVSRHMWEIDDRTASMRLASLTAQVDLLRPCEGLHNVCVHGEPIAEARLLQARTGSRPTEQGDELVDNYVRGTDLVAVYASASQRSVNTQIYRRAIQHDAVDAAGVEIIASVQTSLLDSDPRMTIGSTLPRCDVWRLLDESESRFERVDTADAKPFVLESGAGLFLFRMPGTRCSYIEMIHPADFTATEIRACASSREGVCSEFRLFDEPLERGVIRRGRVRGMFLECEGDEKAAVECYRRFVESAAPLTA